MSGELKTRRRRRGGRGRGRRRGGARKVQEQNAETAGAGAADAAATGPEDVAAGGHQAAPPGDGGAAQPRRQPEEKAPPAPAPVAGAAPHTSEKIAAAASRFQVRAWPPTILGTAAAPATAVPRVEPGQTPADVSAPASPNGHAGQEAREGVVTGEAEHAPEAPGGDKRPAPRGRRKRGARGRFVKGDGRGRGRASRSPAGEAPAAAETADLSPAPEGPVRITDDEAVAAQAGEPAGAAAPREAPERSHRRQHHGVEKTIVINSAPQETRVAILEAGLLTEMFIERESSRTVVGNVYKGRVTKVLPGMQSAFVAVGLERDAFLYVSDISPGYDAYEGLLDLDEVEGGQAIREAAPKVSREAKIEQLIKEGQELLVQVTKEPIGTKGARITSYVTLPGRFLVLMPQVDHVGVSRKIADARERGRLRRILDKVRTPGMGFIVRTVADGCEASELEADASYLTSLWEDIRRKAERTSAPSEIHRELSVVPKVMRDMLNPSVRKVTIDQESVHHEALDLVRRLQPEMADRIQLYRDSFPIFEKFGVQAELDKALRSRVWLKSGGYLVINQTEALVAIDVNTGKYVGKRNLEETVLKTNLEAVSEIVRQLRLRDLGGIIVVDFIDMEERKSRKKLFDAFEKELQKDRARTKVLQISDFGLVEITRQRTKKSLERILCKPCPYCSGAGKIKAGPTVLFEIQRELQKLAPNLDGKRLVIRAHPEVAQMLEADRKLLAAGIESLDGADLSIRADSTLHHEQFDIVNL